MKNLLKRSGNTFYFANGASCTIDFKAQCIVRMYNDKVVRQSIADIEDWAEVLAAIEATGL